MRLHQLFESTSPCPCCAVENATPKGTCSKGASECSTCGGTGVIKEKTDEVQEVSDFKKRELEYELRGEEPKRDPKKRVPYRTPQERIQDANKRNSKEVKEAKGLGKRVKVVKGHFAGEEGTIREIKHGAFKGAPKSYYIDLDNGEMADNLPADVLRLIKRVEEVTIEQDQAESFDPAMEPNHSDTEFERIYSAYENGGEPELAEYLGMSESELDQEMTEYAMDHRLHMDDDRDTVIQGYIEQLIDSAEYKDMGAQMAQYEAKDITDLKRRAGII